MLNAHALVVTRPLKFHALRMFEIFEIIVDNKIRFKFKKG